MIRQLRRGIWALGAACCLGPASATVLSPPAPSGIATAPDYSVTLSQGGSSYGVALYDLAAAPASANQRTSPRRPLVGHFQTDGPVAVTVTVPGGLTSVAIKPSSKGVTPSVSGNSFTFSMALGQQLDLEINGLSRPLFLFADALDTPPASGSTLPNGGSGKYWNLELDDHTIILPAGSVYSGELYIEYSKNVTIYIANGAVLNGHIRAVGSPGLHVYGTGIINNNITPYPDDGGYLCPNLFLYTNGDNSTVDGPTLINNSSEWTCHVLNSSGVTVKNVKIVSTVRDGIDPDGCDHFTADHDFIYSNDDCLAPKSAIYSGADTRTMDTLRFTRCTLWSVLGCNVDISEMSKAPEVKNMLFQDIDVLHKEDLVQPGDAVNKDVPTSCIQFMNPGYATRETGASKIHDVTFDSVRIEDVHAPRAVSG